MSYRTLAACIRDLESNGMLIRIPQEIDPYLEAAEIQRRVYSANGPAIFYEKLKGTKFPAVSNLFGSKKQTDFIFRKTLEAVKTLVSYKAHPEKSIKNPFKALWHLPTAVNMLPKKVRSGPVLKHKSRIGELPQITSWPNDGGPFVTLPEVYSEDLLNPGLMKSNLGMYRIQLGGNNYQEDAEVGVHYQIHRSIGVHHTHAKTLGKPLKVNIFVGGSPAMILGAVMPLPEGMTELMFAGALAGHRIPMIMNENLTGSEIGIYGEADFAICGEIDPDRELPEGPFGDHLGYYSLVHNFPVLNVKNVYHRPGAIWPFTAVGRPPQEDTSFGELIHEITGDVIPTVLPGVKAVHAVDAAGVHPLLLAIGSERYLPYETEIKPQEILTQANAILGQGQLSLAKYLFIISQQDNPELDIEDIPAFLRHLLERIDWKRDVHFQTCTTIDTLDYSGSGLNTGSKVIFAAAGQKKRELPCELPSFSHLPDGWKDPQIGLPGIVAITVPRASQALQRGCSDPALKTQILQIPAEHPLWSFPLMVLVDDAEFCTHSLNNLIWATFTRSNPASDIYGYEEQTVDKHWSCQQTLIIDARIKPWHAPPLLEDPAITQKVDQLGAPGGPLHGII